MKPLARAFVRLHRLLAEHTDSLETPDPLAWTGLQPCSRLYARLPRNAEGQTGIVGGEACPRTAGAAPV